MSEKLLLNPEIIELSQVSNVFMTLKMIILTTNTNLNGTKFTEDFIDGICENQKDYQGIALVVNRAKLENEQYDKLTHEFNKEKQTLGTDMIGSFVSFEKVENEDGSKSLIGEARIMKRFPKTCKAISELYESGELRFSCEVSVRKYDNADENYREVNYLNGLNSLMANCIVSTPAEQNAKPTLLVASLNEDLKNQAGNIDLTEISSGGANMALSLAEKRKMMNEYATKLARKMMVKVRADAMMDMAELASIDDNMVDSMIGLMGEDFNANSYCSFWVGENLVFDDYFVCSDYYNDKMFMVDYSISEEGTLSVSNPRKCKFEIVEVAEVALAELNKKVVELYNLNESLTKNLETKDTELTTLQTEKADIEKQLEGKITELSNLQTAKDEVDQELSNVKDEIKVKDEALSTSELQANEKIISLGQVVDGLKEKLKEIEPIVEQYNQVQSELAEKAKDEKRQELTKYALNSKMIAEKEITEDGDIKIAISELDETKIKSIVADRIVKNNIELSNLEQDKKDTNDIVINVSDTKDLIQPSIEDKYGL